MAEELNELFSIGRDGKLHTAPSSVAINGVVVKNPSRDILHKMGYVPLIVTPPPPEVPEGYTLKTIYEYVYDTVKRIRTSIKTVYDVVQPPEPEPEPTPSIKDYDEAMERHLKSERDERGYTTREPDSYLTSSNARWAQDAKDWVAHRDAVMEYALDLINAVKDGTREPPTLDEFIAGLPKITWTFAEN